ncbi:Phosphoribosylaminoimidazole-succinocarboxamide synthase [Botrimarina colliarenosi]|uniref:Phosphoribosylaminoimidazole-succinocarboxamide synthase n=1 Tax=Botrimarina colliarenosi TaxID=2528001 RepID=A0A5C6AFJ5_9BACT|nr:phosphoribosylaminoimidazolesuccinocarboxamide synthase [Botrimarina colliarenosi]TWT96983.1 Phosphoribosylaminoimidazole-succinocarboxamide synthase [Botrimarina colliarenosi]
MTATDLPGYEPRRGKVRDIYDLGDHVLLVASDRLSAFDWVLPTAIPDKGRVLTQLSRFWFDRLDAAAPVAHHLVTCDVAEMLLPPGADLERLAGRSMLCRKTRVVPFECVARGYLSGSGWKEYQTNGAVCGVELPPGLVESDRLPEPIFTPATKAEVGAHDENVAFDRMQSDLGAELASQLREATLAIYAAGAEHAATCGLLIADTKFEFGQTPDGELLLIDELLTPDSSRFWPADVYQPGGPQPSFDKQFVRDWLLASDWDRESPPPALPGDIVEKTRAKYVEAYERLTGDAFAWR